MSAESNPVVHREIDINGSSWNLTYRMSDGTPLLLSENKFENARSYQLGGEVDSNQPQPQERLEATIRRALDTMRTVATANPNIGILCDVWEHDVDCDCLADALDALLQQSTGERAVRSERQIQ